MLGKCRTPYKEEGIWTPGRDREVSDSSITLLFPTRLSFAFGSYTRTTSKAHKLMERDENSYLAS